MKALQELREACKWVRHDAMPVVRHEANSVELNLRLLRSEPKTVANEMVGESRRFQQELSLRAAPGDEVRSPRYDLPWCRHATPIGRGASWLRVNRCRSGLLRRWLQRRRMPSVRRDRTRPTTTLRQTIWGSGGWERGGALDGVAERAGLTLTQVGHFERRRLSYGLESLERLRLALDRHPVHARHDVAGAKIHIAPGCRRLQRNDAPPRELAGGETRLHCHLSEETAEARVHDAFDLCAFERTHLGNHTGTLRLAICRCR